MATQVSYITCKPATADSHSRSGGSQPKFLSNIFYQSSIPKIAGDPLLDRIDRNLTADPVTDPEPLALTKLVEPSSLTPPELDVLGLACGRDKPIDELHKQMTHPA